MTSDPPPLAMLVIADGDPLIVDSEHHLHDALEGLSLASPGQQAKLTRGPKHYIIATRHGDLWSAAARNGNYLTYASFTADLTTDDSDRRAKEQAGASIWQRIRRSFSRPRPERSLSTAQVQTLFGEFYLGKRFSIGRSGA